MTNLSILITDLSPDVTEKQISDFFSFCGKITTMSLRRKEGALEAVVVFDKESSAKTALLLSNALINNTPITVVPYTDLTREIHDKEAKHAEERPDDSTKVHVHEVDPENITTRPSLPDGEQSATSVVSSILASGYTLGIEVLDKAKTFDEQNNISNKLNEGVTTVRVKLEEFDNQYGISQKAEETGRAVTEGWNQLDNQLHISETATLAGAAINNAVTQLAAQPAMVSFANWTSNIGRSIGNFLQPATTTINQQMNNIREETNREIEEKVANLELNHPISELVAVIPDPVPVTEAFLDDELEAEPEVPHEPSSAADFEDVEPEPVEEEELPEL